MTEPRRSARTSTSSFGVSRREGHDSSEFYARFAAPELSDDTDVHPDKAFDRIIVGDARDMSAVPANSVALVVTSPPYYAGKAYEQALGEGHVPGNYVEFLAMLRDVFAECVRVLEPGGRIAVNVANLGRKPFRSLAADVTTILQDDLRLLLRGEIVWQKQRGASGNCAWGSFRQPSNPSLRDLTERIVVASKGRFDRAIPAIERHRLGLPHVPTIGADEFMEATLDVWELPPESATRLGHPAPFPVSLPERLIRLHTYEGDLVLDPFMGSGSTAVAAVRTGRHYVGYDTDPVYARNAEDRIARETAAGRRDGGDDHGALKETIALVERLGCSVVQRKVKVASGVEISMLVRTPSRRDVLVEVAGVDTSARPGLQRADVLWRVAGKAAIAAAVDPRPIVVVTPALPSERTLRPLVGPGRPISALVDLRAPDPTPFA